MTIETYLVFTAIWGALMLVAGWWMGSKGFASIWQMTQTDISALKTDVSNLKVTMNVPQVTVATPSVTTTHSAVTTPTVLPHSAWTPTVVAPAVAHV